jgi:hypothetical protein
MGNPIVLKEGTYQSSMIMCLSIYLGKSIVVEKEQWNQLGLNLEPRVAATEHVI